MPSTTTAARSSAWLNVAIGIAGLAGPTVTGNEDRIINLHTGHLLGLAAINPPHALLHLGFGALGVTGATDEDSSRRYLRSTAVLFGAATLGGLAVVGNRPGIHYLMGMAVDRAGNLIHATWATFGLVSLLRARSGHPG